ncbi:MAG: hypothetical protein GX322_05320 [Firmicutes bacterium]|nr:hypothetical protein [Bacillota bacterium]
MTNHQAPEGASSDHTLDSLASLLNSIAEFIDHAGNMVASLHKIAENVQSMERDGSLSRLAEFLGQFQQETGRLSVDQ